MRRQQAPGAPRRRGRAWSAEEVEPGNSARSAGRGAESMCPLDSDFGSNEPRRPGGVWEARRRVGYRGVSPTVKVGHRGRWICTRLRIRRMRMVPAATLETVAVTLGIGFLLGAL